jgi:hypothetical protein
MILVKHVTSGVADMPTRLVLAIAVPLSLALAGCGGGSSHSTTAVQNTTVSKGQALIDLKQAYDSGAISSSEYQAERKRILEGP